MILTLIILMSGFMFANRISRNIVDEHQLLTRAQMTKIGTAYFIFTIVIVFIVAKRSIIATWAATFATQALFAFAMIALREARAAAFRKRFRESLTLIVLRMKAGKSFRHALTEVINEAEPHLRLRLMEIRDLVVFSQQNETRPVSLFAQSIINEFRQADQSPHAALRRVETFRERLRLEDDFRHKSGQVLRQIRAQSILLSGLYIAVLVFVASQFGLLAHVKLIVCSIFLFLCGLVWIWFGGRKLRWKV